MKTNVKSGWCALAAMLFLLASAFAQTADGQPAPEKKKHLKMVKIENGVKTELDTVIVGDEDFAWFEGDFPHDLDSLIHSKMKRFEFDLQDDESGNPRKFVFVSPGGEDEWMMHEFDFPGGDSLRHMMHLHHKKALGDKDVMIFKGRAPMPPHPPLPPMPRVKVMRGGNAIDLDAPEIISYKKKDLSGDREKIEIIRKKRPEKEIRVEEEIILESPEE